MALHAAIEDLVIPIGSHHGRTIIVGSDSDKGSLSYKQKVLSYLINKGHNVRDRGAYSEGDRDFSKTIDDVCKLISEDNLYSAGMLIYLYAVEVPNYKGVYPQRCIGAMDAFECRKYHNSNLLEIPHSFVLDDEFFEIVDTWLKTPFYETEEDRFYLEKYIKKLKQKI